VILSHQEVGCLNPDEWIDFSKEKHTVETMILPVRGVREFNQSLGHWGASNIL